MKPLGKAGFFHELARNKVLYLMFLPIALFYILFAYIPMGGIIVAFKDFNYRGGFCSAPGTVLTISGTFLHRVKPGR